MFVARGVKKPDSKTFSTDLEKKCQATAASVTADAFFLAALVHAALDSNDAKWNVETVFKAISDNYKELSASWKHVTRNFEVCVAGDLQRSAIWRLLSITWYLFTACRKTRICCCLFLFFTKMKYVHTLPETNITTWGMFLLVLFVQPSKKHIQEDLLNCSGINDEPTTLGFVL